MTPNKADKPLTFLHVADLHLLDESDLAYPRKVVAAMNAVDAEFTLVGGDVSTNGQRDELLLAKRVLDELRTPYYPIIGNHDAQFPGDRDETLFREVFGLADNSYCFDWGGVWFIAFDTGVGTDMDAPAKPEAIAWLRRALVEIPVDAPLVMFTHYPFARGVTFEVPNAGEILALFAGRWLLAVIGAHFHGNTEIVQDGVLMTTTACASGSRPNHDDADSDEKGFRVFHIDENLRISTRFVVVPAR